MQTSSAPSPVPPSPVIDATAPRRLLHRYRLAQGLLWGALLGFAVQALWLDTLLRGRDYVMPACAAAGALLNLTRAKTFLRAAALFFTALYLLIGYTPLVEHLTRSSDERAAPLAPAPAVVVLGGGWHDAETLGGGMQDRVAKGLGALQQHLAPRLVLTYVAGEDGSLAPAARVQMAALGLSYPLDDVGPVVNTHDEALGVAQLARERGWDRIILVTTSWHMRRAAAVFEKTGLRIERLPCAETSYDSVHPAHPSDRAHAFRDWLHEAIGYQVYRWRGWI